jgi:hypothetical protein
MMSNSNESHEELSASMNAKRVTVLPVTSKWLVYAYLFVIDSYSSIQIPLYLKQFIWAIQSFFLVVQYQLTRN